MGGCWCGLVGCLFDSKVHSLGVMAWVLTCNSLLTAGFEVLFWWFLLCFGSKKGVFYGVFGCILGLFLGLFWGVLRALSGGIPA